MFVFLDANVWLAALACDGFCRRVVDASAVLCTPVTTPFLCGEVREKLVTKFRRTPEQAELLVAALVARTLYREDISVAPAGLRDPKDEPILAAAVTHRCRFLVTGDKDLLDLRSFSGVEIVSVRAFSERLGLKLD